KEYAAERLEVSSGVNRRLLRTCARVEGELRPRCGQHRAGAPSHREKLSARAFSAGSHREEDSGCCDCHESSYLAQACFTPNPRHHTTARPYTRWTRFEIRKAVMPIRAPMTASAA